MDRLKGLREKLPSREQISEKTTSLRERASSLSTSSSGSSSSDRESRFSLSSVKSYIPGQDSSSRRDSIVARPISSLPDVSHFGPPPKRVLAPPPPPPLSSDSAPASSPATPLSPASPSRRAPPPVPGRKPAPPLPSRRSNTISGPHPSPSTFRPSPSPLSSSAAPPDYTESSSGAPVSGTTWQQKQHALQTASRFQRDPASVSLKDLSTATGTARNFQQRHGDEAVTAVGRAEALAQKAGYGAGATEKKRPPPPPPPRLRNRPMSMSNIPTTLERPPSLGRALGESMMKGPPPLPPRRQM